MANNSDKTATLALALAVLDAAELHEASYNRQASDEATRDYEAAQLAGKGDGAIMPDYARFYTKTLQDCCDEAALKHSMAGSGRLIYLALQAWWNDALDWATLVKEGRA